MRKWNPSVLAFAGALGVGVSLAGAADATQPSVADQIKALQAKVDELKARQEALTEQQKERDRQTTVDSVVGDADRHSRLLDVESITAGYSNGRFILRSEDGNFLLHPWAQFQFRNTTTYREDVKQKGTADDVQNGFEVRRLKFGVDGNLFCPDLTYMFQGAVDRHNGNISLEMAWAKYHIPGTPLFVRAGQFKDPLDHEELAASRFFPAADRTLVDDTFAYGEGFIQGASLIYDPQDSVRAEVAFTDGLTKTFNTNFQDFPTNPADFGVAGRVEYKLFGNWTDYDRITAYGVKTDTLVFGAGADYTEAGHTGTLTQVLDAQYQLANGLSFYGAYLGRYTARNTAAAGADTYDPTARAQVSWALDRHWEPYARYEYIHFDGKEFPARTQTNVNVITGGVNYYLFGFGAKFTLDVSYLPNGSPVADDAFGILTDNRRNEIVVRGQFQVVL